MMKPNITCAGLFLLVLNIILGVFVIILTSNIVGEMARYRPPAQLCIPCRDIMLHPDDHIPHVNVVSDNTTMCCLEDLDKIDAFVGQVVHNWYKRNQVEKDPQFYGCQIHAERERRPNIKLVGKVRKSGTDKKIVRWDGASQMTFKKGIEYSEGVIKILTPGLYHVYSHITFHIDGQSRNNVHSTTTFSHTMFLQKSSYLRFNESIIVKKAYSKFQTSDCQIFISSFSEAIVQLSMGDRLYVQVSNLEHILPGPERNVFGAHMLSF